MKSYSKFSKIIAALGLTCMIPLAASAETQTIQLMPGWNLIGFQVIPDNPAPEAVFSDAKIKSVWSYDAQTDTWGCYINTSDKDSAVINELMPLSPIKAGAAYWVNTISQGQSFSLTVNGKTVSGSEALNLNFKEGWNLFSIPMGILQEGGEEQLKMSTLLSKVGFDYDALLTYKSNNYKSAFHLKAVSEDEKLQIVKFDTLKEDKEVTDFSVITNASSGYWIHVTSATNICPKPQFSARSDIDLAPMGNFPSIEDINISGVNENKPKSTEEQDTIRFFENENRQVLHIVNKGGGILSWKAEWISAEKTPESWVRLFSIANEVEDRDKDGKLLKDYTMLSGITTGEDDVIYLCADRKNLGRGSHHGILRVTTNVETREYKVIVDVSGFGGAFEGYAEVESVDGKRNLIPDIDLNLSLYEDNKVDGLLRGFIDSDRSILWPVDVPLIGHRVSNIGNQFTLGGSFILPPGDLNVEPYDKFVTGETIDQKDEGDIDWNGDGKVDNDNPFPFPIQRTVLLEGSVISDDPVSGYVLEGRYSEIIYGMTKEPIRLDGKFHLTRMHADPFEMKRNAAMKKSTIADDGAGVIVSARNNNSTLIVPRKEQKLELKVNTEMVLQNLKLKLSFPSVPNTPEAKLKITLRAPGANAPELLIYDGTKVENQINREMLKSISFPTDYPIRGDLKKFLSQVSHTKTVGNEAWQLIIVNNTSANRVNIQLADCQLWLEGQPISDVYCNVKDENGNPVQDAKVVLNGTPVSIYSKLTDVAGKYKMERVPLLPLNFSVIRPGYDTMDEVGLSEDFRKPFGIAAKNTENSSKFTPLMKEMIQKFNPLAGAPVAAAKVMGFNSGTAEDPFELRVQSKSGNNGAVIITAAPSNVFAGSTVEFNISGVKNTASQRWMYGDDTVDTKGIHQYKKPGIYNVTCLLGTNNYTTEVTILPAPSNVAGKPSQLLGDSVRNALNETPLKASADQKYGAYCFQTAFHSAGSLPASKSGTTPEGADRYLTNLEPLETFAQGDTNQLGAAYVSLTTIQHAYTASMDIDLAPKLGAPVKDSKGNIRPLSFESDGFVPLKSKDYEKEKSKNFNDQGFKNEDFKYSLSSELWRNTYTAAGSLEYSIKDSSNGTLVWGNIMKTPCINYATQEYYDLNGGIYHLDTDADEYHPIKGSFRHEDIEVDEEYLQYQVVNNYNVACSIGGAAMFILTAPTPSSSVKIASETRIMPIDPQNEKIYEAPGHKAYNLYYQLQTGSFIDVKSSKN